MGKSKIQELEAVILDQIEKLNDDSIMADGEQAKVMIEKSRAISELTNSYIGINRMKLDVVKELNRSGNVYEEFLGIEKKDAR